MACVSRWRANPSRGASFTVTHGRVSSSRTSGRAAAPPTCLRPSQLRSRSDEVHVYAVDRLGRDAIDVQSTVRSLLDRGVIVNITGLGTISKGVGELILAVLAQVAQMDRDRIRDRCEGGREAARASIALTGKTHRGKASLGRPTVYNPSEVTAWCKANSASIAATATHFALSKETVKRYCAG